MKIPVVNEENKLAAVKAGAIIGIVPLMLLATLVGIFVAPSLTGAIWLTLAMILFIGLITVVVGGAIVLALQSAYLAMYAKFSGTNRRLSWFEKVM